jgi:hypothetical protein
MRSIILLSLLIVLPPTYGGTPDAGRGRTYPGTISGQTLLRDYLGPPRPRDDPWLKGGDIVNREMARGYMDGIKDATEGTVWCYVSGKPHELNEDIVNSLQELKPEQLKGRAAPLVINALRQLFPCPSTGRKP